MAPECPCCCVRAARYPPGIRPRDLGQGPYALTFSRHRMAELQVAHPDLPNGEEREETVSVAGRVMTRR